MSTSLSNLWLMPPNHPEKMRKADSLDREYLAKCLQEGIVAIVNDEYIDSSNVLLTVTSKAWKEMERLV